MYACMHVCIYDVRINKFEGQVKELEHTIKRTSSLRE